MKIKGTLGTVVGYFGLVFQSMPRTSALGTRACALACRLGTPNPVLKTAHAVHLMKEGHFEEAKILLEEAAASTTQWMGLKTLKGNLAVCEWKLGRPGSAIGIYMDLMKEYGDKDQDYFRESAERPPLDRLVAENPLMQVHDYVSLGYFHIVEGDLESAEYFSRAALELQPESASAYDNLGQAAMLREDADGAKDFFTKALSINPQLPDSLYCLGTLYEAENKLADAIRCYEKAASCTISGLDTITKESIDKRLQATKQRYASL